MTLVVIQDTPGQSLKPRRNSPCCAPACSARKEKTHNPIFLTSFTFRNFLKMMVTNPIRITRPDGMERPNYATIAAYVFLLHVILLISACRSGEKAPDVSHLDGSFALIRTEDILFKMDTLTNDTRAQAAFAEHEEFWNLYFREIMGVGDDTSYHWQVLLRSPYLQAIV